MASTGGCDASDGRVDRYARYEDAEGCIASTDSPAPTKKKTYVMLALCMFCYGLGSSLYAPFFPQQAEEKGLSPRDFGFVIGSHHLTTLFFLPVIGMWVKDVATKYILATGMFTVGGCTVLFGTLQMCPEGTPFTSLAYAVRILDGFGAASIRAAIFAIAASQFTTQLWSTFVQLEMYFGLGLIIGPIAGGALYDFYDFSLPFYCSGALSIIDAVLVLALLPQPDEIAVNVTRQFWSVFKLLGNWLYFFGIFSVSYYSGLLEATLQPHLKQFDLQEVYTGLIFVAPAVIYTAMVYAWKLAVKKCLNHVMLIFISCVLLSGSALLVAPVSFIALRDSIVVIVIGLVLKGFGQSIKDICSYYGSYSDSVARGYPNDVTTHHLVFGMYMLAATAGSCTGSFSGGFLYERIGFDYAVFVPIGLEIAAVPFLLAYAFSRSYKKPVLLYSTEESRPLLADNSPES